MEYPDYDSDEEQQPEPFGLELEGHGPALVTRLFLSRGDGVRITELAGALKDAATADLTAEEAGRQWQEWVDAHGDPVRLLLGQLEGLGAVSATDDVARLEPLGVQAVRSKLERDHLFVPVLPAPDKMTPNDLVLVWMHGSDDDLRPSWPHGRTRTAPMFISPIAGAVSDRIGRRPVMATGLFLQTAGFVWVAIRGSLSANWVELDIALLIAGVGVSMALPTVPTAVLNAVAPCELGKASGINYMMQRFGAVFAIAVASAVFAAYGHLGTPASVTDGFKPALAACAGFALLAALSALAITPPKTQHAP